MTFLANVDIFCILFVNEFFWKIFMKQLSLLLKTFYFSLSPHLIDISIEVSREI